MASRRVFLLETKFEGILKFYCLVAVLCDVVKVRLPPSKKICVICFIESPFKMMENACYFILSQDISYLKIFNFFHDFLVM